MYLFLSNSIISLVSQPCLLSLISPITCVPYLPTCFAWQRADVLRRKLISKLLFSDLIFFVSINIYLIVQLVLNRVHFKLLRSNEYCSGYSEFHLKTYWKCYSNFDVSRFGSTSFCALCGFGAVEQWFVFSQQTVNKMSTGQCQITFF